MAAPQLSAAQISSCGLLCLPTPSAGKTSLWTVSLHTHLPCITAASLLQRPSLLLSFLEIRAKVSWRSRLTRSSWESWIRAVRFHSCRMRSRRSTLHLTPGTDPFLLFKSIIANQGGRFRTARAQRVHSARTAHGTPPSSLLSANQHDMACPHRCSSAPDAVSHRLPVQHLRLQPWTANLTQCGRQAN